jgi:prevent-host-death family protein
MTVRNVTEAKAELSAWLVLVEQGEEVVISSAGKPIARLSKYDRLTRPRELGTLRGQFQISPEFDTPDLELEELFTEESIELAT